MHFAAWSHAEPGSGSPVPWLSGGLHTLTPLQTGCQLRGGHGGEARV